MQDISIVSCDPACEPPQIAFSNLPVVMWDEEGSGSDLGSVTAAFDLEERQAKRGETEAQQTRPPLVVRSGSDRKGFEMEGDNPACWRGD